MSKDELNDKGLQDALSDVNQRIDELSRPGTDMTPEERKVKRAHADRGKLVILKTIARVQPTFRPAEVGPAIDYYERIVAINEGRLRLTDITEHGGVYKWVGRGEAPHS